MPRDAKNINPLNERQLKRLRASLKESRQSLAVFRRNRVKLLTEFVGHNYSDNGTLDKVPVNMIELTVSIWLRALAPRAPRGLFSTQFQHLKSQAHKLELTTNRLLEEIRFGRTFRRIVKDALFGWGICKVGLSWNGTIEVGGFLHDLSQPFADAIDLDNWVHDVQQTLYEQVDYAGDYYSVRLDAVKENRLFNATARDEITASEHQQHDDAGDERARSISQGESTNTEVFHDRVELLDLWLPGDNLVVTLARDESVQEPLAVVEWSGPEGGPYHLLGYNEVPGQIVPLSPLANLSDLHAIINRLYRKLARQSDRQKTVLGVDAAATDDAERFLEANDGDTIKMNRPEAMKEISTGGGNPLTAAFLIQTKAIFSEHAGNLDALGGLGPQSPTATQDELLSSSASKRIEDMQDMTTDFVRGVIEDLAWYRWTDPVRQDTFSEKVPGTDVSVEINVTPETREGDFLQYNFKIDPYSLRVLSPQQRLVALTQIFQQFVAPFIPMMMQQGVGVNFEAVVRKVVKWAGIEEDFEDIFTLMGGSSADLSDMAGSQPAGKPANTTRTNVRINRPGATRDGTDQILTQALAGIGLQDSQGGSILRPVG